MAHADTAKKLVLGDRNDDYGSPRSIFEGTGLTWTGILLDKLVPGTTITAEDVALMMVALKLCRESRKHKDDNPVDAHGYLMCHEWLVTGKKPV